MRHDAQKCKICDYVQFDCYNDAHMKITPPPHQTLHHAAMAMEVAVKAQFTHFHFPKTVKIKLYTFNSSFQTIVYSNGAAPSYNHHSPLVQYNRDDEGVGNKSSPPLKTP